MVTAEYSATIEDMIRERIKAGKYDNILQISNRSDLQKNEKQGADNIFYQYRERGMEMLLGGGYNSF